mgnify:CR=1 FL=1
MTATKKKSATKSVDLDPAIAAMIAELKAKTELAIAAAEASEKALKEEQEAREAERVARLPKPGTTWMGVLNFEPTPAQVAKGLYSTNLMIMDRDYVKGETVKFALWKTEKMSSEFGQLTIGDYVPKQTEKPVEEVKTDPSDDPGF